MKAKDVSVGIQDTPNDGWIVTVRLVLKSEHLEREPACPDPLNPPSGVGTRVKESARKRKEKEIQRLLEGVEYPDA